MNTLTVLLIQSTLFPIMLEVGKLKKTFMQFALNPKYTFLAT